jgi:hypothetical protein
MYCAHCSATPVYVGGDPAEPQLRIDHEEGCTLLAEPDELEADDFAWFFEADVEPEEEDHHWSLAAWLLAILFALIVGAGLGLWLDSVRGFL